MKNLIVFGVLVMFVSNVPGETVDSLERSNDQQVADDIIAIAEDSASRKVDRFIEEEDSGLSNDLAGPLSNDDIEDQATIATNDSFEEQPLDAGSDEPAIDAGSNEPAIDAGSNEPAIDAGSNEPAIDAGSNEPAIDAGSNEPAIEQRRRLTTALENFSPSEEISADNAVPFPVDI